MAQSTTQPETIRLIFIGKLYNLNHLHVPWQLKKDMLQRAKKQFGELPPGHRATRRARVAMTRVLGPREKLLDGDKNVQNRLGSLVDALVQCGYLVDDNPAWAAFDAPQQDETRRHEGPKVEILITYDDQPLPARRRRPTS
jgi:hypothetical protein